MDTIQLNHDNWIQTEKWGLIVYVYACVCLLSNIFFVFCTKMGTSPALLLKIETWGHFCCYSHSLTEPRYVSDTGSLLFTPLKNTCHETGASPYELKPHSNIPPSTYLEKKSEVPEILLKFSSVQKALSVMW